MNQEDRDNSPQRKGSSLLLSSNNTPWSDQLLAAWIDRHTDAACIDQWVYLNNSPTRHASQEVLGSLFPISFFQIFENDPRVSTHVDRILRSRLSWSSSVHWAPEDALWEVAMIAPDRFKRLALLSASFSMKHELTQIIDGSVVRKLRQEIGEDIFQFVLFSNTSLKYFLEPMHATLSTVGDIIASIDQGAVMIVEHGFSSKERGIQERIATKLHGCFAQGYCDYPLPWALQAEQILSSLWKEASSWI